MKKFYYIAIASTMMFSCTGTKSIFEQESKTTKTEKSEITKDSTFAEVKSYKEIVETSAPIEKENSISLKTADSLTNQRINQALKNFKYTERSGNNSVKAHYDEESMMFIFKAYVEATQNKDVTEKEATESSTNTAEKVEKTLEEQVDTYVEKKIKVIPWWIWLILYFAFLDKKVALILSGLIPQMKGATTILNLLSMFRKK